VADSNGTRAAVASGYSKHSAKHTACRLLKNEGVKAAIAAARTEIAQLAVYDQVKAMQELQVGLDIALKEKQMTAYARLVELRAKITGVLQDKVAVTVEHVDIGGALLDARKRVSLPQVEDVAFTMIANLHAQHALPHPFE